MSAEDSKKNLKLVMNALKKIKSIQESPNGLVYAIPKEGCDIRSPLLIGHAQDIGESDLYEAMTDSKWTGCIVSANDTVTVTNGFVSKQAK